MKMTKTTNSPTGLELLSDEESFLHELVDEQDIRVDVDINIEMSAQSTDQDKRHILWQSKPKLWVQRTVNLNEIV